MSGQNNDIDNNDRCCRTGSGRRCLCLPYDDGFIIAAQVMSIVAIFIAWIWWVTFILSIVALVLHQILWCCRQSRASLIAMQVISIIAALLSLFVGVFFLVARKDARWCDPFTLNYDDDDDDYYGPRDYCPEKGYAAVAFVEAALWFAVAGCNIAFVKTGRYDKWEASLSKSTASNTAVEMGNVEATPVAVSEPVEYIPSEVLEKVDEA